MGKAPLAPGSSVAGLELVGLEDPAWAALGSMVEEQGWEVLGSMVEDQEWVELVGGQDLVNKASAVLKDMEVTAIIEETVVI
jgi:hypothetical protein